VGPRIGVGNMEVKIFLSRLGLELEPLDRQTRSQSLYRLLYPGSRVASQLVLFAEYLVRVIKPRSMRSAGHVDHFRI
jgi:hypothetical protein